MSLTLRLFNAVQPSSRPGMDGGDYRVLTHPKRDLENAKLPFLRSSQAPSSEGGGDVLRDNNSEWEERIRKFPYLNRHIKQLMVRERLCSGVCV